jgi:hypothetical protein
LHNAAPGRPSFPTSNKIEGDWEGMSLHHLFLAAARAATLTGFLWSVVTAIVRTGGA